MSRKTLLAGARAGAARFRAAGAAQRKTEAAKSGRIDVDNYAIDAEINPRTQTLTANVKVRFIRSGQRRLHSLVRAEQRVQCLARGGRRRPPDSRFALRPGHGRSPELPRAAGKGKPTTVTFTYDGRLDRPGRIAGLRHQVRRHPERFRVPDVPGALVPGQRLQRGSLHFGSAHITVPAGYQVIASGLGTSQPAGAGKTAFNFQYTKPSFPGSIAVVQGEPVKVNSEGVTTSVYFRQKQNMANAYGEETGKVLSFLTSVYGLAPQANLTLVETEDGTPNGYSAPGIIFLSPRGIGNQVASQLLANQLARQWWETLVSPVNRDHLWLENGNARYAELLWDEHANGPAAMEQDLHDTYVEAHDGGQSAADSSRTLGGLFAGVLGAHGRQGRGGAEHAAQRDGQRQFQQADVQLH